MAPLRSLCLALLVGLLTSCGSSESTGKPDSGAADLPPPPDVTNDLQSAYCEGPIETLPDRCRVPVSDLQGDREAQVLVNAIYQAASFLRVDGAGKLESATEEDLIEVTVILDREDFDFPGLEYEISPGRVSASAPSRSTDTRFSLKGEPGDPASVVYDCTPEDVALCPPGGDWFEAAVGR